MSINQDRVKYLLEQYAGHEATEVEVNELFTIINQSEQDDFLKGWLTETLEEIEPAAVYDQERWDKIAGKILRSTQDDSPSISLRSKRPSTPLRTIWRRAAAAAVVLLMVSVGGYFIFKNKGNKDMAETEPQEKRFKNDVPAPKNSKATITLADGSTVALDSVTYGKVATQGNVNVMVTADGRLVYKEQGTSTPLKMQYNTLSNPRGSKVIDMTLADGSRVWLNAGSSVTYPVAFAGNARKVSITGEAYFEITTLSFKGGQGKIPFNVDANGIITEVLGTHFNVNSYSDEGTTKITLLEGSVKVSKGSASGLLRPGQQAEVALRQAQDDVKIVSAVDIDEVMAWKNGKFSFEKMDIESIMRQMARWYDVDVAFKDKIADKYTVKITRDVPVSQVFKFIEMTGGVHFDIDGNKVVVRR
jgi:transmembrane sensor